MIRRVLLTLALLLPPAALAQAPQLTVTAAPNGPVTVGTPVSVTATVLVPTWMRAPPVWPEMQIADAITRLPERATRPVSQRIGADTWSGIARSWEILPQRPADYDFGGQTVTVTYADPATSRPVTATLPLPVITLSATVPPGAGGMDPFLAATALRLTATIDGPPPAAKPGDSVTLSLTTTASGPPAMLLPPLAGRIPTPPGLRAYPRQPVLTDGPPASRTETIVYVIETPGDYTLPAISLDWWNTDTATRATAGTDALRFAVDGGPAPRARPGLWLGAGVLAAGLATLGTLAMLARRRRAGQSPHSLRRILLRAARRDPPAAIRQAFTAWASSCPTLSPAHRAAIEAPLHALDRAAYGPAGAPPADPRLRRQLVAAIRAAKPSHPRLPSALPALNPTARP